MSSLSSVPTAAGAGRSSITALYMCKIFFHRLPRDEGVQFDLLNVSSDS